jgi:hypothetical protein
VRTDLNYGVIWNSAPTRYTFLPVKGCPKVGTASTTANTRVVFLTFWNFDFVANDNRGHDFFSIVFDGDIIAKYGLTVNKKNEKPIS